MVATIVALHVVAFAAGATAAGLAIKLADGRPLGREPFWLALLIPLAIALGLEVGGA